jgi:hypothetical protein
MVGSRTVVAGLGVALDNPGTAGLKPVSACDRRPSYETELTVVATLLLSVDAAITTAVGLLVLRVLVIVWLVVTTVCLGWVESGCARCES